MTKALVLHSGGLDSSVVLAMAKQECDAVTSISINYGQRHAKEMTFADRYAGMMGVGRKTVTLPKIENSMLTDASRDIPDVSYDKIEGISPAYVPFRNGLMLSSVAAIAQAEGYDLIYYGAHAGDAYNWAYPDCTPEFNGAMANAIYIGTYCKVRLLTPLQWVKKFEIVRLGASLNVPFEMTWSCYRGGERHCGTCPTCRARKDAFRLAEVEDPTIYEV